MTHKPRLSGISSLFFIVFLTCLIGCQQKTDYTYITGEGRCANGKQDPDEFGVDCGGACSRDCLDVRYLEGEIFGRLSLDTRYDYILTGPLIIRDQASLEFPPGTHLKVQAGVGAYIAVVQGGLMFSWGTATNPVTISSNAPAPSAGDWGGIIICGQAPLEGEERKFTPIGNYYYGGNNPNDGSGYLRYLKIEHAGQAFDDQNEFSGLTYYGAGRLTQIDHVWIDNVLHDGIEIKGGNIHLKDVVVTRAQEDALKLSTNWGGKAENLFLHHSGNNGIHIQDPILASSISSSFTLSNLSIVDASAAGVEISAQLSLANFDRFLLSDTPIGFAFSTTYTDAFTFHWDIIFMQNVPAVSNDTLFNDQFSGSAVLPFANANQLPSWLNNWGD